MATELCPTFIPPLPVVVVSGLSHILFLFYCLLTPQAIVQLVAYGMRRGLLRDVRQSARSLRVAALAVLFGTSLVRPEFIETFLAPTLEPPQDPAAPPELGDSGGDSASDPDPAPAPAPAPDPAPSSASLSAPHLTSVPDYDVHGHADEDWVTTASTSYDEPSPASSSADRDTRGTPHAHFLHDSSDQLRLLPDGTATDLGHLRVVGQDLSPTVSKHIPFVSVRTASSIQHSIVVPQLRELLDHQAQVTPTASPPPQPFHRSTASATAATIPRQIWTRRFLWVVALLSCVQVGLDLTNYVVAWRSGPLGHGTFLQKTFCFMAVMISSPNVYRLVFLTFFYITEVPSVSNAQVKVFQPVLLLLTLVSGLPLLLASVALGLALLGFFGLPLFVFAITYLMLFILGSMILVLFDVVLPLAGVSGTFRSWSLSPLFQLSAFMLMFSINLTLFSPIWVSAFLHAAYRMPYLQIYSAALTSLLGLPTISAITGHASPWTIAYTVYSLVHLFI